VLDLASYFAPGVEATQGTYRLSAVICHHGQSALSGHYTATVQNRAGDWTHYNDSNVNVMVPPPVNQRSAYILVYTQQPIPRLSIPHPNQVKRKYAPEDEGRRGSPESVATTASLPAQISVELAVKTLRELGVDEAHVQSCEWMLCI
jgi:hypothetical protein